MPAVPPVARYGERKAIVAAEDWEGPSYEASKDAAMVCPKIRNATPA
jgi:hypothetical protein